MSSRKPKSHGQEALVKLNLRLNGAFVTGLTVHQTDLGKTRAEMDADAVRLPHNDAPERVVAPSTYLVTSPVPPQVQ